VVLESPFYIPMTGPAARPRRSLEHDDTFIVLDSHGDIGASAGGRPVHADTRYLARLELVLDDVQPLLLGSNLRDDNSALAVDLTNPDIYRNGRIVLPKRPWSWRWAALSPRSSSFAGSVGGRACTHWKAPPLHGVHPGTDMVAKVGQSLIF
jgi:hypothetical protein